MADWRPMLNRRNDGIPRIMGVLNLTPDSFHADSRVPSLEEAVRRASDMVRDGAEWIDIGGESTRPGATPVNHSEEARRVVPVVEAVRSALPDVCISIDTRRASVALAALNAGADMVNDVSALSDQRMVDVVSQSGCPVCIMHMQGLPENMQDDPLYGDVVAEVRGVLNGAARMLFDAGVAPEMVIADPGIGFGKGLKHNLALLAAGRGVVPHSQMPLMWGVSRKTMFHHLLDREDTRERLAGTLGVAAKSVALGVDIIRVHDVVEHADMFAAMSALDVSG